MSGVSLHGGRLASESWICSWLIESPKIAKTALKKPKSAPKMPSAAFPSPKNNKKGLKMAVFRARRGLGGEKMRLGPFRTRCGLLPFGRFGIDSRYDPKKPVFKLSDRFHIQQHPAGVVLVESLRFDVVEIAYKFSAGRRGEDFPVPDNPRTFFGYSTD